MFAQLSVLGILLRKKRLLIISHLQQLQTLTNVRIERLSLKCFVV